MKHSPLSLGLPACGFKPRSLAAYALFSTIVVAACSPQAPHGQVVATVNGQEITAQDLAAEARAGGQGNQATPQSLLQTVIAHVLLAQEAHTKGLDQYPGYPSDVARLQRQLLEQKLLQSVVKAPAKPNQAELAKFMADRPYIFAQRQKFKVDEVRFQASKELTELNGASSIADVVSRLERLNAPVHQSSISLDTAALPADFSAKLASEPTGQLFYVRSQNTVAAMVIQTRESAQLSDDDNTAFATNLMNQIATQTQITAEVTTLKNRANIAYQSGYKPPVTQTGAAMTQAAPK